MQAQWCVMPLGARCADFSHNSEGDAAMQSSSQLTLFLTVIALLTGAGFQAAPRAEEPKNLLKNPGAEVVENDEVDSWGAITVPPGGDGRLARTTDQAHSGKASFMGKVAGGDGFVQWVQNVDKFPSAARLRLSGFIKSKGDVKAHIQLQAFDDGGQQIAVAVAKPMIEGGKDWTKVRTDATAIPRKAKQIIVRLVLSGNGQAWFDDLSLEVERSGAAAGRKAR
jgi:hypothetical protein